MATRRPRAVPDRETAGGSCIGSGPPCPVLPAACGRQGARRGRPVCHRRPNLGAVVALSAYHALAQGTALPIGIGWTSCEPGISPRGRSIFASPRGQLSLMTAIQRFCFRSFLNSYSDLCVGHAARPSVGGSAGLDGAYGRFRVREGHSISCRLGRRLRPRRLAAPDRSVGLFRNPVGRMYACAAGAPPKRGGERQSGGSTEPSPAPDGRLWTAAPRACLIADRAYDVDACRAAQGMAAVMPARRMKPQSHAPYAQCCLGFPSWAAAWIRPPSNVNAT